MISTEPQLSLKSSAEKLPGDAEKHAVLTMTDTAAVNKFNGKSAAEIAGQLGISEQFLLSFVDRANAMLNSPNKDSFVYKFDKDGHLVIGNVAALKRQMSGEPLDPLTSKVVQKLAGLPEESGGVLDSPGMRKSPFKADKVNEEHFGGWARRWHEVVEYIERHGFIGGNSVWSGPDKPAK